MGGSSPRMRGALHATRLRATNHRIIPAYAGSTLRIWTRGKSYRDHPRVCGEHGCIDDYCINEMGSSPRMRGALIRAAKENGPGGIIPAYAGSTEQVARPH